MADGVVFAVAGAKGGVGKTTTSINLSAVLTEFGHSIVLVELDIAMANVCDFLDVDVTLEDDADPTLHDVLSGHSRVQDAVYTAPGGFDVMPSGATLEGYAAANINLAERVVETLRQQYGVVILDTGAGVGAETIVPLKLADETILVSSPRVASVRDTKKTSELVRRVGGTVAGVVFSKSGSGRSPPVERISEFLSVDLLGHIPEDSAVASAQDVGQPVVSAHPESGAAKAYGALGSRIHDRVGPLRASRVREKEAQAADEREQLTSTSSDGSGFDFVDDDDDDESGGSAESASQSESDADSKTAPDDATADSESEHAATETAPAATNGSTAPAGRQTERNGETSDADKNGQTSDADKNGQTETRQRSVGRPGRLSTGARSTQGATDDEIARQLEAVEAAEEDETEADSERDTDADTGSESESEPESRESAAKRFIDRAIGLVDRRQD